MRVNYFMWYSWSEVKSRQAIKELCCICIQLTKKMHIRASSFLSKAAKSYHFYFSDIYVQMILQKIITKLMYADDTPVVLSHQTKETTSALLSSFIFFFIVFPIIALHFISFHNSLVTYVQHVTLNSVNPYTKHKK